MSEYSEEATIAVGEGTGDSRVDAVLTKLDGLGALGGPDSVDLAGQLTMYTDLQASLAAILDSDDELAAPAAP